MKSLPILLVTMLLFGIIFQSCSQKSSATLEVIDRDGIALLMESGDDITILDVRTAQEASQGMLPGAINFDWLQRDSFVESVGTLDKHRPLVVYCMSGKRSTEAAKHLVSMGFEQVYNFSDGYVSWE